MISTAQRKALESKGYTVSESGMNVLKDGKAVGGMRTDGNIWSGSSAVTDILKGKPKKTTSKTPVEKPKVKPKPQRVSVSSSKRPKSRRATSAPKTSKRPQNVLQEAAKRYKAVSPSNAQFATNSEPTQKSSMSRKKIPMMTVGQEDTSSVSWTQFSSMSPDQREALGMPRSGTRRSYRMWRNKK